MTRPIRNTGPCFPSGLPRQRGQRDVLSHTEFYTPIFCMLSVFQAIPFELPRKPPTVNRWDSTLGTPGGDKYYNQYRPQCEVCPRDHGKVVQSLWGVIISFCVLGATESSSISPFHMISGKDMALPVDTALVPKHTMTRDSNPYFKSFWKD